MVVAAVVLTLENGVCADVSSAVDWWRRSRQRRCGVSHSDHLKNSQITLTPARKCRAECVRWLDILAWLCSVFAEPVKDQPLHIQASRVC
jgi:hypothetical protein